MSEKYPHHPASGGGGHGHHLPGDPIPARLVLSDGTEFKGFSFGAKKSVSGEAVFQTGMVGYPESLTDPSYTGQLLCLTFPMIGNYGVPDETTIDEHGLPKFFESDKVHPAALIVQELSPMYSHWNASTSLSAYLDKHGVPGIFGVDTRALTKLLRKTGSMMAKLVVDKDDINNIQTFDPNAINVVAEVSTNTVREFNPQGDVKIVAVDVGLKYNQIRCLASRGAHVKLVPWDYDFTKEKCDGLFLSNGPGDPVMATATINHLKSILSERKDLPVFGICLGHQLLSIACGGSTYKLVYGNRGHNQPCIHKSTGKCYITSQNHGFATDIEKLPVGWEPLFTNANDNSNEGIVHGTNPWFSVQFHPEASAGPEDLECLFDVFLDQARKKSGDTTVKDAISAKLISMERPCLPFGTVTPKPRKILVLGSGGLTIGQAGEFDYSGSQAIKALKEEGIQTVLINPNIATVQTMKGLADKVYFLPVTPEYVEKTIIEEKPDGILLSFGGQTALNCGIELEKQGILERHNVQVLGTPVRAIEETEDREIFADKMTNIGEQCIPAHACTTVAEVLAASEKVGFPLMMRSSFALGGLGSGVVTDKATLDNMAQIAFSSTTQVTIEPSMKGWKEVEYEVVRDAFDNTITVCNMENFDPLGIHTGESIVIAPSQTLSNAEYNILRNCAVKVVRHLGIVGECNIQYALNPHSHEFYIIEVNARLSRSSALASKATGYPLAYVAAKLALGYNLADLRNSITKKTTACFEPSLDYCVVKVPRWDLGKFPGVDRKLGTAMKSVGEVMAIGRTFQEAFQKSLRMLDIGLAGFEGGRYKASDEELSNPTDYRALVLASALEDGYSVDRLYELTKIDKWFLNHCKAITDCGKKLKEVKIGSLSRELLLASKMCGFSDKQIGACISSNELAVRIQRGKFGLRPFVKQIDTVAAEYPAQTNYLYLTYHGVNDDIEFTAGYTMVLGSGVYRIGSSVEFDYCAVGCVRELRSMGRKTIMLNYNPETVSTDYDECDRLYFEQLTFETVMDVYTLENASGVVLAMGGQIPNNMAMDLQRQRVNIYGTSADMVDGAENRFKFSRMCDQNNIDQPRWKELTNVEEADKFCSEVTYPCLMRPSYILSGVGMRVVHNRTQLEQCFAEAKVVSRDYPVVISKFIMGAKEIEVDAVAMNGKMVVHCISEHVENAGIHSGDATIIHPPQDLTPKTMRGVEGIAAKIAKALQINGPFNIQFIAKDDTLKVIETNVRVSRSFPFVSKTTGIDLIKIATRVMVGVEPQVPTERRSVIGVKVPQFSFTRLAGADPTLGVDMISTGEVACFGHTKEEAYLKALQATHFKLPPPKSNILLSIGSFAGKQEFSSSVKLLTQLGYVLYGSPGTADYYEHQDGIQIIALDWVVDDDEQPDIRDQLAEGKFSLVINLPTRSGKKARRPAAGPTSGAATRRGAVDYKVPLVTDIKCAKLLIKAIDLLGVTPVVGEIDRTYSNEIVKLPPLVATSVLIDEAGKDTAVALAGGFGTVCVHSTNLEAISVAEFMSSAVSDIALIQSIDDGENKPWQSPKRRSRSVSVSASDDWFRPVAFKTDLSDTADHADFSKIMSVADNLPEGALLCFDASDHQLATVLLFALLYDKRVHVQNVASKIEMKMIIASKKKGLQVTCGVSLASLFEDGGSSGLWDFIDDIDVLSVKHTELSSELEIAIPLLFGAVAEGRITTEQVICWLSTNPARIFSLDIESNNEDSWIEVDIEYDHVACKSPIYERVQTSSVFAGSPLKGRVSRTVLRDELVFVDGKVFAEKGFGNCIAGVGALDRPALAAKVETIEADENDNEPAQTPLAIQPEIKPVSLAKLAGVQAALKGESVLTVAAFTRDMLKVIFDFSHTMHVATPGDLLRGKVLASVFYEPSTRTSCSFSAAMLRLGGSVIPLNQIANTSVVKGESLGDFMRTMECYSDVIVLRHPEKGSVTEAAESVNIPVINAGDGTGEHPTQALLDVFTIREELGTVNGLTITMMGDLKHGRTVHSLAQLLAVYNVTINYVAPMGLEMPQTLLDELTSRGVKQNIYTNIQDVIATTDVLYVTRLQKERLPAGVDPESFDNYVVDGHLLSLAKEKMVVMHPLPRVNEIHVEVDTDQRAAYFRQMEYGMYVRMALLALVLGETSVSK